MAIVVTEVFRSAGMAILDVESTADADVAAVVPHGLGYPIVDVQLAPLQVEYYTSAPVLGVIDRTNVNLVLANAVGSGAAGDQIRVTARIPEGTVR